MPTMTPATRLIDAMMADEAILGRLIGYDAKIANFRKVLNDETVADELRLADVSMMLDLPEADLVALANGSSFRRGAGPAGATTRRPGRWRSRTRAVPRVRRQPPGSADACVRRRE